MLKLNGKAGIAQLAEHLFRKQKVAGSTPTAGYFFNFRDKGNIYFFHHYLVIDSILNFKI